MDIEIVPKEAHLTTDLDTITHIDYLTYSIAEVNLIKVCCTRTLIVTNERPEIPLSSDPETIQK